jgi:hypothetical protein
MLPLVEAGDRFLTVPSDKSKDMGLRLEDIQPEPATSERLIASAPHGSGNGAEGKMAAAPIRPGAKSRATLDVSTWLS